MKSMVPLSPRDVPTHLRVVPAFVYVLSFALCAVYIKGPPGYWGLVKQHGEAEIRLVQDSCFAGSGHAPISGTFSADHKPIMGVYIGSVILLMVTFLALALRQRRGEKSTWGKRQLRWAWRGGVPWMIVAVQVLALMLTVYWFYRLLSYRKVMAGVLDVGREDGDWGLGQFLAVLAWAPLLWITTEGVLGMFASDWIISRG